MKEYLCFTGYEVLLKNSIYKTMKWVCFIDLGLYNEQVLSCLRGFHLKWKPFKN